LKGLRLRVRYLDFEITRSRVSGKGIERYG